MSIVTSTWQFRSLVLALGDSLNLQRRGMTGKPVGDVIADLIAYGIIIQTDKGLNPEGYRLPALKSWYLRWKLLHGYNTKILHMTDQMMDFRQVKGMVVISKDAMTMFYGITPHEMDKAEWAHEGQHGAHGMSALFSGWRRPPREFYGINANSWKTIDSYIDAEIDAVIMSLGARRI